MANEFEELQDDIDERCRGVGGGRKGGRVADRDRASLKKEREKERGYDVSDEDY